MALVYLTLEQAIAIHGKTVEVSGGGSTGLLETGKLEAVLQHIQNDDYYPTFDAKLTHLFFCACKFHCFQDGNKRIAITPLTPDAALERISAQRQQLHSRIGEHQLPRGRWKNLEGTTRGVDRGRLARHGRRRSAQTQDPERHYGRKRMKLHFEPNLDYQIQAFEAVCGLFHGQETCRTEFTITPPVRKWRFQAR